MSKSKPSIQRNVLRATYSHFALVAAFAAYIVVYDASQLIAPDAVLRRWQYCLALLTVSVLAWYLARTQKK